MAGVDRSGLVGHLTEVGHIRNLGVVDANIVATGTDAGILVGLNKGFVTQCFTTGAISGVSHVGGLVGTNDSGQVSHCYSTGRVEGIERVGGLVGYRGGYMNGHINHCFSTGLVMGNVGGRVGGLIGDGSGTLPIGCFWDIETSGQVESRGGMGMVTEEMFDIQTYVEDHWDFWEDTDDGIREIWLMSEEGYPVLSVFHGFQPVPLTGEGTKTAPYLITSAHDLAAVGNHDLSAHFQVTTDIDLAGHVWHEPILPWFNGTLDGSGFAIRNMTLNGISHVGLIGTLARNGEVLGLNVIDASIVASGDNVGALVAVNWGMISDCRSSGSIRGIDNVGGLVGWNWGLVIDCTSTALVNGSDGEPIIGRSGSYGR
jgi:hypothetical protein